MYEHTKLQVKSPGNMSFVRMFKGRDGRMVIAVRWKMGSRLKEIHSVELLDARGKQQQRQWEEEARRRQREIELTQRQAEDKRKKNGARLAEMSARWRNLEGKRHQRSEEYLERIKSSLSMDYNRPDLDSRQNTLTPSFLQ